jgi:hypothetical protein
MISPVITLPIIGAILVIGAGLATYGTAFFWLWLVETGGLVVAGCIAFRGVR